MADSIGGIQKFGMNYTPISNYNKLVGNNLGNVDFNQTNQSLNDFQNILDNQMNMQTTSAQNPETFSLNAAIDVNAKNRFFAESKEQPAYEVSKTADSSPVSSTAHDFSRALDNGLNSLNQKQLDAQNAIETLASGGDISVHDVMIASQKASLNMQMAMQLRNKMLTAYNEIYQMRF